MHREQLGEQSHHGLAVFQHVGNTGRRPQVILQHIEVILFHSHQIDTGNVGIDPVGQLDPTHLRPVHGVVQHLMGADEAGLDDLLFMVDVLQKGVQRPDPLLETLLQAAPFFRAKDARHDVKGNQPFAAVGLTIYGESDPQPPE